MNPIQDVKLKPGIRILLRCDLNVPQDDSGNFTDLFRLESSLPTIEFLIESGATIFIVSHLGSPKGKKDPKLSLEPVASLIGDAIGKKVHFVPDPFQLGLGLGQQDGVFLLENIRFWQGEEENSEEFAKELISSTSAELLIQDAFGVAHRSHSSLVQLPRFIPASAGLLLQKEVEYLSLKDPEHLNLIVGGAKVESKLPVIANFLGRAESVLTGGVVANTFLKSAKNNIAASLFSAEDQKAALEILEDSKLSSTSILLPEDYLAAKSSDSLLAEECTPNNIQPGQMILDLGEVTISKYCSSLSASETIVWAGTLGFAENPIFKKASLKILSYILDLKRVNPKLKIIIGGGDTVDFVRSTLNPEELSLINHLSTGGGASLLMLSGKKLPGIEALEKSSKTKTSEIKPRTKVSEEKTYLEGSKINTPSLGSKTPILVANLKAHFNLHEAKQWLDQILDSTPLTSSSISFKIATPAIFMEEFSSSIKSSNLKNPPEIFAQDISEFSEGATTGEVSASMVRGIASGTLLGHSERRIKFSEENKQISQKVFRAVDAKLSVILCVGAEHKDRFLQMEAVSGQLATAISPLNSLEARWLSIAYEPVFAIGTGDVPSLEYLKDRLIEIRKILSDFGLSTKVLYGGSVNESNAKEIINLGFDGLLVGSASLIAKSLEKIANEIC